jgi:sarcosine oxidase, subunit beta
MNTFDAIIIGGGIHGASTAFHLSQRGLKVLVIEKDTLAAHATGRSSGLIRMHYDLEPESRLAWESFNYFVNWDKMVGGDCGFTRTGFLQFIKADYVEQLKANVAMHQRIGIRTSLISVDEVRKLAPHFWLDDIEVAAYEPESGYADPSAATTALMTAARNKGSRLIQGETVTGILVDSDKIKGIATPQGKYFAPIIVNAAGSWAGEIAKLGGVDLPITTWRHDTMIVKRPPELSHAHPTVIDDITEMYFRPETGGLTLVGLEDSNPLGNDPSGYVDRAQPGFVERAIDRICRRIPAMENASLHSDHGGYDGISPDQRAILGQMGPEGFYHQCGFSGTGFKIAPAVGVCMAELLLDGQATTVDITPFAPHRFAEGNLLTGEHPYDSVWR